MKGFRNAVHDWLPQAVVRMARRSSGRATTFTGNYASWAAACASSDGYEKPDICAKAVAAARAVRDGSAAFERDTVLFAEPEANWPVLACLLRAAACHGGRLHVVDFGGALGSTWWQHRSWLQDLPEVKWEIVEQSSFVEAGRREFEVGPIRFRDSLDACSVDPTTSLLLFSSVLPYLESPYALLEEVVRRKFQHVAIDRTGFMRTGGDRLTVQHVPPSIYCASYPSWFFERQKLMRVFSPHYRLLDEWSSLDEVNIDAEYRGMLFERVPTA